MAAIDHSEDSVFRPELGSRLHRGTASAAERLVREVVWLLIAVAFCVVEAVVFLTDLPIAKFFQRRTQKR